jgi:chloride channel 7
MVGKLVIGSLQAILAPEILTKLSYALRAGGFLSPFCVYVGISLLYGSVAGALVSFVEPLAAGSGIAEVKTYLNGIHIRGLLAVSAPGPPAVAA